MRSLLGGTGGSGLSDRDKGVNQQQVQLKVLEAYTRDVGRGVARLDYNAMGALGVSTGDVIEIKGKRRTVAKCVPLYPSDEGRGMLRIDGLIRNNGGVAIGDVAVVNVVKAPPAEKVVVAPLEGCRPSTRDTWRMPSKASRQRRGTT